MFNRIKALFYLINNRYNMKTYKFILKLDV